MPIDQIHSAGSATLKGASQVIKGLTQARARTQKALTTGIKIEAYRLNKRLKADLRKGAPGGRRLPGLSDIAKRLFGKAKVHGGVYRRLSPNRNPLAGMATGVRYRVQKTKPFSMAVGFVTPTGQETNKMGSWRWLAKWHSKGFSTPISSRLRHSVIAKGADMMKKSRLGRDDIADTPFFLKKSTRVFRTPPRPIMEPFWAANKNTARHNIRRNFKLKMKGVRI